MRTFLVVAALAVGLLTVPAQAGVSNETPVVDAVVGISAGSTTNKTSKLTLAAAKTAMKKIAHNVSTGTFWKPIWEQTRYWSGKVFLLLMAWMLLLTYLDSRHPRKPDCDTPVSVVIPCYNDAASVQTAIASVFKACRPELVDLIVINDRSTDDSLERIREMTSRHSFRIIDNPENKGKARSLNDTIPLARHEFVLCLDADTFLNRKALSDMLARMTTDKRLGAVSSPYRPANRGFLPLMQGIEYSMLLLTQGAHNITSAMALWGGCLMVRKAAFEEVKGFRLNAITEDVDMAFRLNRMKWRVEQSFRPVRSLVPNTLRGWIRQKIRWTSGGTQCYFRHFRVWIRNPIQIFFIMSYSLLISSSVLDFFDGVDVAESVGLIWDGDLSFWQNVVNLKSAFQSDLFRRFRSVMFCCSISCIYILPLINRVRDIFKLFLVIPFSMIYFPIYTFVSFFGTAIGIRSLIFPKQSDIRGWDTGPTAAPPIRRR